METIRIEILEPVADRMEATRLIERPVGFILKRLRFKVVEIGDIYYPYWHVSFILSFKRGPPLPPSEKSLSYLVDACAGRIYRAAASLPIELIEVEKRRVVEPVIQAEEAVRRGGDAAVRFGRVYVKSFWTPKVKTTGSRMLYVKFWLAKCIDRLTSKNLEVAVDSYTGRIDLMRESSIQSG